MIVIGFLVLVALGAQGWALTRRHHVRLHRALGPVGRALRATPRLAARSVRTLCLVAGCLGLIIALDWAGGTRWHQRSTESSAAPVNDLRDRELPPPRDQRFRSPAYRGETWVTRYFAEMDQLEYGYVPYIGPRLESVRGRHINSADGLRRSYTPEGGDGPPLEVWFFGGSTMWGEGQRDEHTIPSEVARLAEEDGVNLRVLNFGERGYTSFQELLLFERELAERGPPDLAVFYDGVNELGVQQQVPQPAERDQPTMYQVATLDAAFETAPPLPRGGAPEAQSAYDDYVETSLLHKVLRRIGALDPTTAGAQEIDTPQERLRHVENAVAIYRRSARLIQHLGERHGVAVELCWQPDNPDAVRLLPAGVHDLSDAWEGIDPTDLYIDGGHTNEFGAHRAAVALWAAIAPTVEGLAR